MHNFLKDRGVVAPSANKNEGIIMLSVPQKLSDNNFLQA